MLFDALTHLHRMPQPEQALERGRAAGVTGALLAGLDPPGWAAQLQLAACHPGLVVALGLHPWIAARMADTAQDSALEELAARCTAGVAIGEIGLDRSRSLRSTIARQRRAFIAQLQLARAVSLPVVLHIVRAHGMALELLTAHPPPGGYLHSYSGPAALIPRYAALGLRFSFGPRLLHPAAQRMQEAAIATPADRLLVESDCPDQATDPAVLHQVLARLAALRGDALSTLSAQTAAHARAIVTR